MSSKDKSKTKFSPSNNLFEKIKNNFELDKKNVDTIKNAQHKKGFTSFIQKTRPLSKKNDLNRQLVTGIARRLLDNVSNNTVERTINTSAVNSKTEVQESINALEHTVDTKLIKNSYKNTTGSLSSSSDKRKIISPEAANAMKNRETKKLNYLYKEDIENAAAKSRNLAGIQIKQKKFVYENISKISSSILPSQVVHQETLSQKASSNKNNFNLESTVKQRGTNNNLTETDGSTLINKTAKSILLGAFNDTHMLSVNLKQELTHSREIISKLKEENEKIKKQNDRVFDNYQAIYVNFTNLFDDLKKLRKDITVSVEEHNNLKNEFSFLKNEIVTLKNSVNKINKTIEYFKDEIKENKIQLVKKNIKLLAKEKKINLLKFQKNDHVDAIKINDDIISSLEQIIVKNVNQIQNFFKKELIKVSGKQTECCLDFFSKECTKQKNSLQNQFVGIVDYNKIKVIMQKIIDEKALVTLETNKALISNKLIPYLNANIAKIDEKWITNQNKIFKNFNLLLSAFLDDTTRFFFQKFNVIEEEIIKLKDIIQTVELNNKIISSKFFSLKIAEGDLLTLKKEILENNYQNFNAILQKINVFNKLITELLENTQKITRKPDYTLDKINSTHTLMKQSFNKRTDFLEQELCELKKLVNDNLKSTQLSGNEITSKYYVHADDCCSDQIIKFTESNDFDEILSSDEHYKILQKHTKQQEKDQCTNTVVPLKNSCFDLSTYNRQIPNFLQVISLKKDVIMTGEAAFRLKHKCTTSNKANQINLIQDASIEDLNIQKWRNHYAVDLLKSKSLNTVDFKSKSNKITKASNKKLNNKKIEFALCRENIHQTKKKKQEDDI